MYYKSELGLQGNIELALQRNQEMRNKVYNEVNKRMTADTENREAVEQMLTDQMLDMISAQQDITELQLEILGG